MGLKYTTVFTAGSFDLLHSGHINLLKRARKLGYMLIVGLSTDNLIKKQKGSYPILTFKQRKKVLESVKYVTRVVKQKKLVDIKQFKRLNADIFIIGDDWKNRTDVEGLNWLRKNKKVVFITYTKELSTTKIKYKVLKSFKVV